MLRCIPISMVIAVQANAEVEKMLPAVQKVGSAISAQILGDDGEAAVIEFDHRIQTLGDFSSDPDKLSAALKKLKPGSGSSRLNDATIEGVNMLRRRPVSRRRILLLIAESRDNGSEMKAREVLSAAEFADVVIYAIDISKFVAFDHGFTFRKPEHPRYTPAGRSVRARAHWRRRNSYDDIAEQHG